MQKHNISIITLGCSKNVVDSEVLMRQLESSNINIEHDSYSQNTNTVVINTCGFISDAKEESINTILRFSKEKEDGNIKNLFVMGCLSQRYKSELEKEIPNVDKYFGVSEFKNIVEEIGADYRKELVGERKLSTPKHFAYLKISEGCDRTCSFCAIPLIRGKHISKPIEILVSEAKYLASIGVKELILIAQDLTYYGNDIYKKQALAELLDSLVEIDGIEWIRLHYAYPANFPVDVLQKIKNHPKICNYLDIPFQHFSNSVLQKMKRRTNKNESLDLIEKIRQENPNIALRTTILVGHPGETDKDFQQLFEVLSEVKFDRLGVFTYSEEEDTFAAEKYEDNIPEETKNQRKEEILELQQGISMEHNLKMIGRNYKVLIDRLEGDFYIGRTEFDSPEVDNEILISSTENQLKIGEFYDVKLNRAEEYDIYGEIV
ncbi:MAG: 30S ribosomal protein S12 methylthiotransferase RimO [Bacteroidetes bacterium]|jgi:ribosomal protein S12 methylthiotransferase|nr:30S ribosomal protein S12 methylthiotransferase RimO [Bacteroidota bacterium]MBT6685095.1 30S ribosomal protein S12 methylthiotransferase RimO [Bacteroidota bacterium]MBT7141940.1 30S ribosomal protein S12 methylthiotransferase RimO [Bacteroidota bacterium]MBT7491175.1 30S ribosomal protein S12 methylthiotransferase RimO [Bacteroidota bacterium]